MHSFKRGKGRRLPFFALLAIIFLISSFFQIIGFEANAQSYPMCSTSGIVNNVCSGTFTDDGGSAGPYAANLHCSITFWAPAGKYLFVSFSSFNIENNNDSLLIYKGGSVSSPLLGVYTGNNSPGMIYSTQGGAITFLFTSNNSIELDGWEANIACVNALPSPPINDDPCSAIFVSPSSICSYITFSNSRATSSSLSIPSPGCGFYQGSDIWFKTVVPSNGILSIDSKTDSMIDGAMAVYKGTCNSLTRIACDNDGSSNGLMPFLGLSGLIPGDTIWIRFWEFGNDNNGSFGFCVSSPQVATNDDPCNAFEIPVTLDCQYLNFSNLNATATISVPSPSCANYQGADVWFRATVPDNGILTVKSYIGSLSDCGMAIYSGSCNSLTLLQCNDDASTSELMPSIFLQQLTPGSVIYIRIWDKGGDNIGNFGLCVMTPVRCKNSSTAGEICSSAIPVCNLSGYCGRTSPKITPDAWLALQDSFYLWLLRKGSSGVIENDSYLSFVANNTTESFNIYVTSSQKGLGVQLLFFEAACGSSVIACKGIYDRIKLGGPTLVTASPLVPGNTYYLLIDGQWEDVCDYSITSVGVNDVLNAVASENPICSSDSTTLSAEGGNGVFYSWSPSVGLSNVNDRLVKASPPTTTTYTVKSLSSGSCPDTITATVIVNVADAPPVPVVRDTVYCVGTTVAPLSAIGTNLLWYDQSIGGEGSTDAPTVNTTNSGIVDYWVSQTIDGCESPREKLSTNVVQPATISNVTLTVCDNYFWSVNSTSYTQAGTYSYVNDCNISVLNLTFITPPDSNTTITVCSNDLPLTWRNQLISTAGIYHDTLPGQYGCDSIFKLDLVVTPSPSIPQVNTPVEYCQFTTALPLIASGTGQLLWYSQASGGTGSPVAPIPGTDQSGTLNFYVSQMENNCESERTLITVKINPKPELGSPESIALCNDAKLILADVYPGQINGVWSLGGQVVSSSDVISLPGTYQFIAITPYGCRDTGFITISFLPPVPAYAGEDDSVKLGNAYQLNGSGGNYYSWSPETGLNNPYISNPTALIKDDTRFILTVGDNNGCKATDTVFIKIIFPPEFYIPTAFTPNGDGLNDFFGPTPMGAIAELEYFKVYDRFGRLIFSSSKSGRGWDGKFKGVPQEPGNYVWMLKGKSRAGIMKTMKGNVMLVR